MKQKTQKIIHCSDADSLSKNLIDAGFYTDTDGDKVAYLPVESEGMTHRTGNASLICVLITDEKEPLVESVKSLSVLGTYDEIFADPELLAIYDSIYDRSEQTIIEPETGEEQTYTPPDRFAEFALPERDLGKDKKKRNRQAKTILSDTSQVVMAYQEQKQLGKKPDISEEQYKQTLQYREQLRVMIKK